LPHDVTITPDSRVYVLDRENARWQVFTTEGEFQSENRDVRRGNDIAIDADGAMHVVTGSGVEIWRPDGTLIGRWGEKGDAPGPVRERPARRLDRPEGSIYIAEVGGNDRLQKFRRV
jgi:hypothetical protein